MGVRIPATFSIVDHTKDRGGRPTKRRWRRRGGETGGAVEEAGWARAGVLVRKLRQGEMAASACWLIKA